MIIGIVRAFPDGQSITGSTGAPGETACSCHGNLNIGSGSATIIAPGEYSPGDTLDVTVKLKNVGQMRWGFAVTVLDGNDLPSGELLATDQIRTFKSTAFNDRQYIKQTEEGTDVGTSDSASWDFQWIAPTDKVGDITFYAAGLAANNDSFIIGDSVYTATLSILRTDINDPELSIFPNNYNLRQNYPNPFNLSTQIDFTLARSSNIKIEIYDALGQRITTLVDDEFGAGYHSVNWYGLNEKGNEVASGIYLYRIETGDYAESRKMLLLK
jgi:hypothetical protein